MTLNELQGIILKNFPSQKGYELRHCDNDIKNIACMLDDDEINKDFLYQNLLYVASVYANAREFTLEEFAEKLFERQIPNKFKKIKKTKKALIMRKTLVLGLHETIKHASDCLPDCPCTIDKQGYETLELENRLFTFKEIHGGYLRARDYDDLIIWNYTDILGKNPTEDRIRNLDMNIKELASQTRTCKYRLIDLKI